MSRKDEETQAVTRAAMRFVKTGDRAGLESYSLPVLKKADYQLSDRDVGSGYRRAITDLIVEREREATPQAQEDIIDVKPNFMGLGLNFNALLRRLKNK